ncbi:MAG TPA: XdhC family protein [Ktedonobacteraceae bacterium]|nr:XdhC family protein [Ktedonobacteraceae bacterium]
MTDTLLELAYRLTQANEPYVLATVVWCERPTSAKVGARAIIQADGTMTGWIGGSCAQPVVIREAQRILREGDEAYLLRLGTSETAMERDDMRVFPMSCASGGVLDIYMEPHIPLPQLVLIGESPVVGALMRLAEVLDFSVTQLTSADLSQLLVDERTSIIVATHGFYDEDALEQALRTSAGYIGMVGSPKRADACRAYLRSSGFTEQQIERIKAPVGLDIGAVTPAEIAASILAELVQVRRRDHHGLTQQAIPHEERAQSENSQHDNGTAIDLVCGMMVEIATARHHSVVDGQDFYFCCPACKRLFERNPQEYLVKNER